ncbi:MAG: phage baseplate assembly protein V [Alphaproteobacteria bacterium]|nr:MAG: phage baseplate assembly protein V [Alphaproteobacteria bacterium]
MLIYGEVTEVDGPSSRVRMRIPDRDGMSTHWLQVPQASSGRHQTRVMPAVGERVAAILDEDGIQGCVLGGIYTSQNPAPDGDAQAVYARFEDGTVLAGDGLKNWHFTVPSGGRLTFAVGANAITIDDSGVTIRAVQFNGVRA